MKMKRLYAMVLAITMCFTVLSAVPVGVSANTAGFNNWFANLPTLTDQNFTNIQSNETVNDSILINNISLTNKTLL